MGVMERRWKFVVVWLLFVKWIDVKGESDFWIMGGYVLGWCNLWWFIDMRSVGCFDKNGLFVCWSI